MGKQFMLSETKFDLELELTYVYSSTTMRTIVINFTLNVISRLDSQGPGTSHAQQ